MRMIDIGGPEDDFRCPVVNSALVLGRQTEAGEGLGAWADKNEETCLRELDIYRVAFKWGQIVEVCLAVGLMGKVCLWI